MIFELVPVALSVLSVAISVSSYLDVRQAEKRKMEKIRRRRRQLERQKHFSTTEILRELNLDSSDPPAERRKPVDRRMVMEKREKENDIA